MVTWQETKQNIKADLKRRLVLEEKNINARNALMMLFKPCVLTVFNYRISRYCNHHHLKVICKLLALLDQIVSTSEISPIAKIGPGLVLADNCAVGIPNTAAIGNNCTFFGVVTFTLGAMGKAPDPDDVIQIGDHCVFGAFSRVIRPVSLANGTQIKPSSVVISSIKKEGTVVSGIPAKRKQQIDYQAVKQWNPLKGHPIGMSAHETNN